LLGALVGLLTVALTVALWGEASRPRGWLRWVGLLAVAAVIGQGVLGGLRVVLLRQTLAVVHGIVAQAFFALVVALAVWTSKGWEGAKHGRAPAKIEGLRRLCAATAGLLFLQMAAGVLVTHTGTALQAHLGMAGLAALLVFWVVARVHGRHWDRAWLARPARAVGELMILQLLLGVGAYLARFTALGSGVPPWLGLALPLAHRLVGTVLWGTSLVLALRVCRLHALPRATAEVAAPIWQEAR
jgi:cytochrome c oxidase assembly protein subunit 15